MMYNPLNRPIRLQMSDRSPCQRSVDLQPFDEDGDGDEAESWDFLDYPVVEGFIESDCVLSLVLDFSFGPFLLLLCFTAG